LYKLVVGSRTCSNQSINQSRE